MREPCNFGRLSSAKQRRVSRFKMLAFWRKLHERVLMTYKQQVENMWELLAKVLQCPGQIELEQGGTPQALQHDADTATATQPKRKQRMTNSETLNPWCGILGSDPRR